MTTYAGARDLDNWGALGNDGWSWKETVPYLQGFQNATPPSAETATARKLRKEASSLYGVSGPVKTSFPSFDTGNAEIFLETMRPLYPESSGHGLRGDIIGAHAIQNFVDQESATRSSALTAYYIPNKDRTNLHVKTEAHVRKLNISDDGSKSQDEVTITGVTYTIASKTYTAEARREVILSAGSYHSPQILELSGIGSRSHLKSLDIETIIENDGVGENLQEHGLLTLCRELNEGEVSADNFKDPAVLAQAQEAYALHKTGPFSAGSINAAVYLPAIDLKSGNTRQIAPSIVSAVSDLSKKDHLGEQPSPNLQEQYSLLHDQVLDPTDATVQHFLMLNAVDTVNPPVPRPGAFATGFTILEHPFSRGSVHISSTDPTVQPTVDPRFLSHPLDIEFCVQHLRNLELILDTPPLANKFKPDGARRTIPPDVPRFADSSDDVVKDYIRRTLATQWHPVGTCAMLPREKGGVVDSRLRVYGTKNLRVVDASVFPLQVRGNPCSLVYAVAERAARWIKGDERA